MAAKQESQDSTRQHVLQSACEVLAEKGYRDATIHEICDRAGANIAAVNYYFGSKENLYAEAWRYALRRSLEAHPPDGGVSEDASPEERLRGRLRGLLGRVTDEKCAEARMMDMEMANPTGLLKEVAHEAIAPLREGTEAVIRELLGSGVPEKWVQLCGMSVVGPCMSVMHHRRVQRALGEHGALRRLTLDNLIDHFTLFSLGGIQAVRKRYDSEAGGNDTGQRSNGE